jgi:hypothetical protein
MDTTTDLTPQQIGSYWAVPTIDSLDNSQVQIHVSISMSPGNDQLNGSDVTVQVVAGGNPLSQLSGPDTSSALPTVETRAITAFAIFTFDNSQNATITSIVVTVQGQSATFALPDPSLPVS